jgi:hypothetical protein
MADSAAAANSLVDECGGCVRAEQFDDDLEQSGANSQSGGAGGGGGGAYGSLSSSFVGFL